MDTSPIELRTAVDADCDLIRATIAESARTLGRTDYTRAQIEAALGGVWGLDTQLVADGTYYIASVGGEVAGCGGWSFRATLFGSDAEGNRNARRLDPAREPARIRAFFVRPAFARRGVASAILDRCEAAASAAGFRRLALGATAPGLRFYRARGFVPGEPFDYDLGAGLSKVIVPMEKRLTGR